MQILRVSFLLDVRICVLVSCKIKPSRTDLSVSSAYSGVLGGELREKEGRVRDVEGTGERKGDTCKMQLNAICVCMYHMHTYTQGSSDLLTLVQVMCATFGDFCPLYTRQPPQPPALLQRRPYTPPPYQFPTPPQPPSSNSETSPIMLSHTYTHTIHILPTLIHILFMYAQ